MSNGIQAIKHGKVYKVFTRHRQHLTPIMKYGKKVPKGFYESGKGIHLGKGIWLLRMRPNPGIGTRKALAILNKLK